MREELARDLCLKLNEIGRFPDWMVQAFDALTRESPAHILLNMVVPVADVLSVASRAVTGELTTTAMAQLPNVPAIGVLVQADPANADNVLLGLGAPSPAHQLVPGVPFAADISNLNLVWVGSAGVGAVRVTFTALQL